MRMEIPGARSVGIARGAIAASVGFRDDARHHIGMQRVEIVTGFRPASTQDFPRRFLCELGHDGLALLREHVAPLFNGHFPHMALVILTKL